MVTRAWQYSAVGRQPGRKVTADGLRRTISVSPLNNDIRPDRKIETGRHDPEFARKLAAVKKKPMDHIDSGYE